MAAKHRIKEPSNAKTKERMEIKYPDWEFAICEVCFNWCVVLPDIEGGFHPLCYGTKRWQSIYYARRRDAKNTGAKLFGG